MYKVTVMNKEGIVYKEFKTISDALEYIEQLSEFKMVSIIKKN